MERLTDAYLSGVLQLEEYRRRRLALDQQRQSLAQHARQVEHSIDRQLAVSSLISTVAAFCVRIQAGLAHATFEQQRQLIELLVDRVVVTNDDVEIRYVIPTTTASEHVRFCHLRADYFGRVTVPLVGWSKAIRLHALSIAHLSAVSGRSRVNVTIPL